jgi:ubiquinol-cytochrome c reductase cytochrome c subunit
MGYRSHVVLLAVLLAMCVARARAQAPSQAGGDVQTRGDAQKGRVAFMSAGCYTCHGTVGQGGAGARLAPNPLALEAFTAYVRSGRRGWSVTGGMPGYRAAVLSDQDLADIRAYLASIPAPPPAASIPLLKD